MPDPLSKLLRTIELALLAIRLELALQDVSMLQAGRRAAQTRHATRRLRAATQRAA